MLRKIMFVSFFLVGYAALSFSVNVAVSAEDNMGINIPYISGGIGSDEREALSERARDFNLKLVFATTARAFLADIAVQIADENGNTIVNALSEGPWFFAKLPPGKYTVSATTGEETVRQNVKIQQTGQSVLYFFWTDEGMAGSTSPHRQAEAIIPGLFF